MKIVLVCHFSNPQLRVKLNLFKGRHYSYKDFGLWNVGIINGLKKHKDVELHIIMPHQGMRKCVQEFSIENVHYHIFRPMLPFPLGSIENHLYSQERRNYPRNRKYVRNFIKSIKPDLVNLIGAENPYYSITALDIEKIPVMIHCQTVYANPDRLKKSTSVDKKRWNLEVELLRSFPYVACNGSMYYDLIKGYNPNAIVFPRKWPKVDFPKIKDVIKKYDFAYFSHFLSRKKGFDNVIEALGKVIKKQPEMKILAVGGWDSDRNLFEHRIKELGIENNLEIHSPFPEYTEMLQYVKQARFALLPIKMDVVSGTIIEAMRMGMPVITSRTSGTPSLNTKRETVLISDIDDNDALAQHMLNLYENQELAETLKNNAFKFIEELDEMNYRNVDTMVSQYKAVIEHYHQGTPIPCELLFNIEIK